MDTPQRSLDDDLLLLARGLHDVEAQIEPLRAAASSLGDETTVARLDAVVQELAAIARRVIAAREM
jgi:hypothetical protein